MNTMQVQRYDLIIMGGGMTGSALACLTTLQLQQQQANPLRIAIIESSCPPLQWSRKERSIRVSAISRASEQLFRQIGAWQDMQAHALAYQSMRVWDQQSSGRVVFNAADSGEPNLGYIIENREILGAIQARFRPPQSPLAEHIDYLCPLRAQQLVIEDNQVQVLCDNDRCLQADLIVGADGAHSWLRQQADIDLITWSYQQHALVALVRTEKPHEYCCWQQFMPEGPLAFLPLDESLCAIVWSTSKQQAEQLLGLSKKAFNQCLSETFSVLGTVSLQSDRAVFPLRMRHAKEYVKPHLALIGDAAHTIHPLAGQGVNLGFEDVRALADNIVQSRLGGKPIGHYSRLRRYERARKSDNMAMISAMEGLKRLFSNNNKLLATLRGSGLNLVNQTPLLKQFFSQYALGNPEKDVS